MLNPILSIFLLNGLTYGMKEKLYRNGIRTLGMLMTYASEEEIVSAVGKRGLELVRDAIKKEEKLCIVLAKKLKQEGYDTERSVFMMTIPQILDCYELSDEQIGRILRYQRDLGDRHYEKQELVHTTCDGRIYHCDHCSYRNPSANFCGVCMQMIKDDMEIARQQKR